MDVIIICIIMHWNQNMKNISLDSLRIMYIGWLRVVIGKEIFVFRYNTVMYLRLA